MLRTLLLQCKQPAWHCGQAGDLGMLLAGKEWVAGMEDGVGKAATLHAPLVRFPQVAGWFVAARVHGLDRPLLGLPIDRQPSHVAGRDG